MYKEEEESFELGTQERICYLHDTKTTYNGEIIDLILSKDYDEFSMEEKILLDDYIKSEGYSFFIINIDDLDDKIIYLFKTLGEKLFSVEFYFIIPYLLSTYEVSIARFDLLLMILLNNPYIISMKTIWKISIQEIKIKGEFKLLYKLINESNSDELLFFLDYLEGQKESFFRKRFVVKYFI